MSNTLKTILTAFVITFSGMFASSASAMSPKPGQACILGICWDKPNKWTPNYGGRADADIKTSDPTQYAMWGNHGGNIFDPNAWKEFYRKENWHVDSPKPTLTEETQLAFGRRGSTCSSNPYGRRSSYCKDGEIDAPLQNEVTASSEFGSCLLDDTPLDIEQLVDCRSDACLGRKFYYGSFGKVGR